MARHRSRSKHSPYLLPAAALAVVGVGAYVLTRPKVAAPPGGTKIAGWPMIGNENGYCPPCPGAPAAPAASMFAPANGTYRTMVSVSDLQNTLAATNQAVFQASDAFGNTVTFRANAWPDPARGVIEGTRTDTGEVANVALGNLS